MRAAIDDALHSPLLRKNDIYTSKRILFNLYYNPNAENKVKMSEINDFKAFTKEIRGLDVIYGVSFDESLGEKVKVSILASGFKSPLVKKGEFAPGEIGEMMVGGSADESDGRSKELSDSDIQRLSAAYGADKIAQLRQHRDAQNFVILTPEQMEDDMVIELLEKTPAFNRDQIHAEAIRAGRPVVASDSRSGNLSFAPSASGRIGAKKTGVQPSNDDPDDLGEFISFVS